MGTVDEVLEKYTPEYAAKIAGVPASMIMKAAEIWGPAATSFLLHARGIEHHSKGVQNCMAAINLVVATGRIGREGCGYAMITGQGNGQGGREQGQKNATRFRARATSKILSTVSIWRESGECPKPAFRKRLSALTNH